jgi:plasmid stabilization system protein ParE
MPADLVLTPEVEQDILDAYAWYEQRRSGLGEEFLTSVEACFERLCRFPVASPIVYEGYRRSLIRRFPYGVFYEFADQRITVYAVFHTARDPEKWRQRLP